MWPCAVMHTAIKYHDGKTENKVKLFFYSVKITAFNVPFDALNNSPDNNQEIHNNISRITR